MPSSGVVTFTATERDIIEVALGHIRVYTPFDTLSAEDYTYTRRALNMLAKQWMASADFAPGLKMWTRKRATLFPQKGQISYDLGPTGSHWTASYVETTLSVGASNGAGTITVSSVTGITSGYYIGVTLSTGAVHWTTVNGAPAGSAVTLSTVLAASADIGSRVICYQTKARRPLSILTATLRFDTGSDMPLDPMIMDAYEALPDKTHQGTPLRQYYEPQLGNGKLYLDCTPEDVGSIINFVYLSPVEDFTSQADTADFSQEWLRPLAAQLSIDVAPAFKKSVSQELMLIAKESLAIAQNVNPAVSREYFQPGLE